MMAARQGSVLLIAKNMDCRSLATPYALSVCWKFSRAWISATI